MNFIRIIISLFCICCAGGVVPAQETADAASEQAALSVLPGVEYQADGAGVEAVSGGGVVEQAAAGGRPLEKTPVRPGESLHKGVDGIHAKIKIFEDKEWLWLAARIAAAFIICAAAGFFIRFIIFLFAALSQKITNRLHRKQILPESGKNYLYIKLNKIPFLKNMLKISLLDKVFAREQMIKIIVYIVRIVKYFTLLAVLYITLTAVLGLFEPTRSAAITLLGYIWHPLKTFLGNFISYLPELFFIIVTLLIVRYLLKVVRFITTQIEKGRIIIPGFHTDWASPTYKLLQIFIYALTLAIIYPHLPNANSDSFKGVSVLVGFVISFGSSAAIGNLVAGIVITYMRTFKTGDLIKIGDITGFVTEKTGIVTRIKTTKNEYITFPNVTILTSSITNYHKSCETENGFLVHRNIGMGYSVPWRQVHKILIDAALKTEHLLKEPQPFVNQLELADFYCVYEINAYTKRVDILPRIYSELFQNVQDGFTESGISMYAPHFTSTEISNINQLNTNDTDRN
ncbi:MAG: mechanosensitive ion channel family protein [Spirochaetaceae bacterium]|nr:mechanosensitive ion channel family protein [Spirochaetaceae bacterium]